jgi:hypothetical protein
MRATVPFAVLPCILACATATSALREPLAAGNLQRYALPADTLAPATARAFAAQGLQLVLDTVLEDTRLILASRGVGFSSWGEYDRAAITPRPEVTEVRILSRPVAALDVMHTDRSPRLFESLDHELRSAGLRPVPGDRVRIVTSAGPRTLTGVLLRGGDSTEPLVIDRRGKADSLFPPLLARLWVSRGKYGHAKEGATVGSVFGAVVGLLVSGGGSGELAGLARVAGLTYGMAAGLVVGGLTGTAIRTEVWSELAVAPH